MLSLVLLLRVSLLLVSLDGLVVCRGLSIRRRFYSINRKEEHPLNVLDLDNT